MKLIDFIKNLKMFDKSINFILCVIEGNDASICYEKKNNTKVRKTQLLLVL